MDQVIVSPIPTSIVSIEPDQEVTVEISANGPQGVPGPGIAPGGITGQVLSKVSDDDYDTFWKTVSIANTLATLSDVDVSSRANGSTLVYNEISQKFVANSSTTILALTDGGNF